MQRAELPSHSEDELPPVTHSAALAALAVLYVGFALVSVYFAGPFFNDLVSRRWPTTPATVLAAGVTTDCTMAGGHSWHLSYVYTVDGVRHEGTRDRFGSPFCGDQADAAAEAARYSVGQVTPVHYDPSHPERAVMRPGAIPMLDHALNLFIWLVTLVAVLKVRRETLALDD